MSVEPRPELLHLEPVVHGGNAPPGLIDFSTGISPLATPEPILRAAREADLSRYPDPTGAPLRARVAELHGVSAGEVVAGAGSVELIWALARAFGGAGREVLMFAPAFGEYAQAARASGARLTELGAEEPPFALDRERALSILTSRGRARPSLAFLARPSNPGLFHGPASEIEELARAAPDTLFVVDEAYLPMFDEVAPVRARANLAVLRSLTKIFALAGLRAGYLVADRAVARAVQSVLPPWNLSAPASAAALAALADPAAFASARREIARLREALERRLAPLGVRLDARGGPFLLYRVGDAAAFARRLEAEGVRVRDGSSFGLPAHVRVGVRGEADQEVLASAWRRSLS